MSDQPWAPITPLDSPYGPRFPVEALPTPFRAYAQSLSEAYQVPVDLPALLMLATASTPLAKRIQVKAGPDWIEPCNLYVAVVLPPASRKSAIFKAVTAPLEHYEQQKADQLAEPIADARQKYAIQKTALKRAEKAAAEALPEDQAAAIREAQAIRRQLPSIPTSPRILVDDVSPEKLASLLAEQDGRLALMSAEGGVFDLIAGRYSNGAPNLDVYLKAHAGDSLRVDRVGRESESVESPALTIGLTIQPEVLRGLAEKPGFRGRGLLARFLFSLPRSGIGYRKVTTPPVHPGERAAYFRIILDLYRQLEQGAPGICPGDTYKNPEDDPGDGPGGCPGGAPGDSPFYEGLPLNRELPSPITLTLTPEGAELLQAFRLETEHALAPGGAFEFIADWAGKYPGVVARIAAILHMVKHAHEQTPEQTLNRAISADTMRAALVFGDYLANQALIAFEFMGADPSHEAARHVLVWIERSEHEVFKLRDAHQALKGRYNNVDDVRKALKVLEEYGYVRGIPVAAIPGPGRKPSPRYSVNPDIYAQYAQNSPGAVQPYNSENYEHGISESV